MHFPLPLLSDEDKVETSEGGLDLLGLVQVAEADARHTETLAQRIPLPAVLASQLAFRLEVNADA